MLFICHKVPPKTISYLPLRMTGVRVFLRHRTELTGWLRYEPPRVEQPLIQQ